jgi:fructose-1,6-bisphosphatase I
MNIEIDNILFYIKESCREISKLYREINNIKLSDKSNNNNKSGDNVKKLDIISNDIIKKYLNKCKYIKAFASEEEEYVNYTNYKNGQYFVSFDPLDGSQNIEVNFATGSIFGIFKYDDNIIKSGNNLVASCYCIYGPSTQLVIGYKKVSLYSLINNVFTLIKDDIKICEEKKIYSINEGNYYKWISDKLRRYIDSVKGRSIRWSACMVTDVHRLIMCGGCFIYPNDTKYKTGRLRLVYEIFPLSFIVKLAGGHCINEDNKNILTLDFPSDIHDRESILMFNNNEFECYNNI